ncbi:MAG TPA: hypothetical protein VGC17_07290 [Lactovum miscens]|uniref:hypothetical protein n=1 Tax=Lactovum miscens TaxID=190387 RepID=UPI002EDA00A7
MINTLNPKAKVISPTTLKRDLNGTFQIKFEEVKSRMGTVPGKISFTIDGWTSKNVLSFVSIRSHFINAEWKYESVLLDFVEVDGSHSGLNMSKIFLDCLRRFEIPLSNVMGITMDNVTSNDTFMEHLQAHGIQIVTNVSAANNRVRCLTHILNLSVQDLLNSLKVSLKYEDAEDEEFEDLEDSEDENVSS